MEALLALLAVPAYAAVIAVLAFAANRVLADDDTVLSTVLRIQLDPPRRGVEEEEPLRWNLDRLRGPVRTDRGPSTVLPTGAPGGLEGLSFS
jgi:hypothetical protein